MASAASYIQDLQSRGQYQFTTEEAVRELGGGIGAVRAALRRLKDKTLVASPYRGFFVIVPPEYRQIGCLPADQFVPNLMEHLGEPYYAALLSAAMYHGAAHQRPQVFQVMIPRARRTIACGGVRVGFTARHDMVDTPIIERNTPRGVLRIASPEATALEIIGYAGRSGGLNNVATLLQELVEVLDPAALQIEAYRSPLAWVQRLGYLLVLVNANQHANVLDVVLANSNPFIVALSPSLTKGGVPRDPRWKVAVNTEVEPDL